MNNFSKIATKFSDVVINYAVDFKNQFVIFNLKDAQLVYENGMLFYRKVGVNNVDFFLLNRIADELEETCDKEFA